MFAKLSIISCFESTYSSRAALNVVNITQSFSALLVGKLGSRPKHRSCQNTHEASRQKAPPQVHCCNSHFAVNKFPLDLNLYKPTQHQEFLFHIVNFRLCLVHCHFERVHYNFLCSQNGAKTRESCKIYIYIYGMDHTQTTFPLVL